MKHKHQWITIGSTYNKDGKRITVKKRCRDPNCRMTKEVKADENVCDK